MGSRILAGTDDGVHTLGGGRALEGRRITAIAGSGDRIVAIADQTEILAADDGQEGWRVIAAIGDLEARCLLPTAEGILIGTSEAHLQRLAAAALEPIEGFEAVAGREDWFTPWGGPPATRSLSEGAAGELYANVHVGGIPRSDDGGATWQPTLEIGLDAHEVRSPIDRPGLVLSPTAHGLATSRDHGATWAVEADGLHATYARAIALAGDTVLMSASDGPRGGHAAVYRRRLDSHDPFERCTDGPLEWFDDNIDTGCLQAIDGEVAFGTADGEVYVSADAGEHWERGATGLPPIRCLMLAA